MGNLEFEIKNGNGKVKEFNNFTDKLVFEIKYLNGDEIEFEGEYLNRKRNDTGKERIKKFRILDKNRNTYGIFLGKFEFEGQLKVEWKNQRN